MRPAPHRHVKLTDLRRSKRNDFKRKCVYTNNFRDAEDAASDMLNEYFKAYEAGGYSPKLLRPEEVEPGTIVFTEEDDVKRLEFARMQVIGTGRKTEVFFIIIVVGLFKVNTNETHLLHYIGRSHI